MNRERKLLPARPADTRFFLNIFPLEFHEAEKFRGDRERHCVRLRGRHWLPLRFFKRKLNLRYFITFFAGKPSPLAGRLPHKTDEYLGNELKDLPNLSRFESRSTKEKSRPKDLQRTIPFIDINQSLIQSEALPNLTPGM